MELDLRQQDLKERFTKERGYWHKFWDGLLDLDADFLEAYLDFSTVPWKKGPLDPKVKELIYIAIDANTTHLYEPGLRNHIRNALKFGATKNEILEVYELASILGIHSCTMGVPILADELRNLGYAPSQGLSPRQQDLKKRFTKERGYWHDFWDDLLDLDPDFFEAYLNFSTVPWKKGPLEPKLKELIYIAINATTTHLYEPALRIHIRNAMKLGATREELLEVLELVSALGMHACTMGVPILVEELNP